MAKRNKVSNAKYIVGGIIIFVMVTSAFGVIFGGYADNQAKIKYNGFTFTPLQYSYRTVIDDRNLEFSYEPNQLESIKMPQEISALLERSPELDMTYNYSSDAAQEFALAIFQMQESYLPGIKYVRDGATGVNTYGKPVITCADATKNVPVILFTLGNETSFRLEGDCIIAQSMRLQDVAALKDRLVYSILGVME